jgi:hypothetical protein
LAQWFARRAVKTGRLIELNARMVGNKMAYDAPIDSAEPKLAIDGGGVVSGDERATLDELVEVLSAHPRGLRRWSVMRAMRTSRTRRGRDIPHKFEDEVERIFRRRCVDGAVPPSMAPGVTLFYRPKETAGEVWAVLPASKDNSTPSE